MILQALNDLYGRLEQDKAYRIAPPGFSPQKISFRIVIKPDGSLFKIEDARSPNEKGKLVSKALEVPLHEKRTSGVKAQFMCDKLEYVLGYQPNGKKEGTGDKCFNAFKEKHLIHEHTINSPSYSILCKFLSGWSPNNLNTQTIDKEMETGFGVFQILGDKTDIHHDEAIKNWWIQSQNEENPDAKHGQCLVTGDTSEICRIHHDIKGFKSSIALVGIQENTSYESYGLSKTENCPVSEEAAFNYATALNALLAGPKRNKHRINIANTSAVFWTEKPTELEDSFAEYFGHTSSAQDAQDEAQRKRIEFILRAIRTGKSILAHEDLSTPFYILGLEQPNPGRFAVRFFHRSTTGNLVENLKRHHQNLQIVSTFETDPDFPAIWQLLDQVAPPKR